MKLLQQGLRTKASMKTISGPELQTPGLVGLDFSSPEPRGRQSETAETAETQAQNVADEDIVMVNDSSTDTPGLDLTLQNTSPSKPSSHDHQIKPPAATPQPVVAKVASVFTSSTFNTLLEFIEEIGLGRKNMAKIKSSGVHSQLHTRCRIRTYQTPAEMTRFYAKELLQSLSPAWRVTPFFQDLKLATKSKEPFNITEAEIAQQLVRRGKHQLSPGKIDNPESPSDRQGMKNPHSTEAPRHSGKQAGLRLAAGGKKRLHNEIGSDGDDDADSDDGRRGKKAARTVDNSLDNGSVDDDRRAKPAVDVDDDGQAADQDQDDIDSEAEPGDELVRYVIRTYKVPSTTPTGPYGAWRCQEEGCEYIVRNADEQAGQDLIWKHFEHHGDPSNSRVKLAVDEAERGNNPIRYAFFPLFLSLSGTFHRPVSPGPAGALHYLYIYPHISDMPATL